MVQAQVVASWEVLVHNLTGAPEGYGIRGYEIRGTGRIFGKGYSGKGLRNRSSGKGLEKKGSGHVLGTWTRGGSEGKRVRDVWRFREECSE